jgi:formylglycine-generating enzyme required for sulfatase activity
VGLSDHEEGGKNAPVHAHVFAPRMAPRSADKMLMENAFHSATNPKDGSVLVRIDAGWFRMGSTAAELARGQFCENPRESSETIAHSVFLNAFYISRWPITNKQYRAFVEATGHDPPDRWDDPAFNDDSHPVIGISWEDAQAYVSWAGLRLPTEAEWERAAAGPLSANRCFPWGEHPPNQYYMNYSRIIGGTTPVTRYAMGATPDTGIMDMGGNVLEWCADDLRVYSLQEVNNPVGPLDSPTRAIRGGSFVRSANECRSRYRDRRAKNKVWGSTGIRPAIEVAVGDGFR